MSRSSPHDNNIKRHFPFLPLSVSTLRLRPFRRKAISIDFRFSWMKKALEERSSPRMWIFYSWLSFDGRKKERKTNTQKVFSFFQWKCEKPNFFLLLDWWKKCFSFVLVCLFFISPPPTRWCAWTCSAFSLFSRTKLGHEKAFCRPSSSTTNILSLSLATAEKSDFEREKWKI